MITAKITCTSKQEIDDGVYVSFSPDYADERNKEWAIATPALSLSMSLKGSVADRFEQGTAYTLSFAEGDE